MSTETTKVTLSAITAGCIAAGGSILVVALAGYAVTQKVVIIAFIVGVVQAAKDVRSMLHMPAIDTGSVALVDKTVKPPDTKP